MHQLELIAWLLVAPLGLITLALALELAAGLTAARQESRPPSCASAVVVVPAHDEEAGIGQTVASLMPTVGRARILVVADNCSDATALCARQAGAEVIERVDTARRGKGYALAFAQAHLSYAPPDIVCVIDADCRIDQMALGRLISAAQNGPVQALNLLQANRVAAPMVQVSNFAFFIRNDIRQRGLARLAGRVHLTGTGMAFPWPVFATAELATGNIVEDLGLGLDLAEQRLFPQLVPDALVTSPAALKSGALKQRARWEGGFLATAWRRGLPIITAGIRDRDVPAIWSGISLCVPPLALLLLLDGMAIAACALLSAMGGEIAPLAFLAAATTLVVGLLACAWAGGGRRYLTGAALLMAPLYLVWKLPLYAQLIVVRDGRWTRSDRETPS